MAPKQNLAAVRKMAAKKGGQMQFQIDVGTDEEWNNLLEKRGLIVVDVYSEWCGPCVAMVSSLKKLKLEIGCDELHFAIAKCDNIEMLKRFRNKSEPTWMIIASGNMVNLMFGVDAPKLTQLIKEELNKELNVLQGKEQRNMIPFDELTETEKERLTQLAIKEEAKLKLEQKKLDEKLSIIRKRSLTKLSKLIPTISCIMFFPHTIGADGNCTVAQKMMYIYDVLSVTVVDQIKIQLNQESIKNTFYDCPIFESLCDVIKIAMETKPVLVTLIQSITGEETDPITPRDTTELDDLTIEQKLSKIIYGNENATYYTELSAAYEFIVEDENGNKLLPMWTPCNSLQKSAALEVLFPRKVEATGYIPEKLPPPQIVIIYDAIKACDLNELIQEYADDVFRVGFFDNVDPHAAKLICKKYEQFRSLPDDQLKNARMVISLKKGETEDVLLEFSQVVPLYISPDEKIGSDEALLFFPFDYDDIDDEEVTENNEEEEEKNEEEGIKINEEIERAVFELDQTEK